MNNHASKQVVGERRQHQAPPPPPRQFGAAARHRTPAAEKDHGDREGIKVVIDYGTGSARGGPAATKKQDDDDAARRDPSGRVVVTPTLGERLGRATRDGQDDNRPGRR